ncbi:MAG: glycoside hydrolase family 99-like domain-containing protein, partial [Sphingomonas sp.]
MSLVLTPLQRKFHRLIQATRTFDAAFYARNNPDVEEEDLLAHYIARGEEEGRAPSPFFDPAWYARQLHRPPEGTCLLAHYLTVGDGEGYQPMVGLDPAHVRQAVGREAEPALVGYMRALEAGRPVDPNRFFDTAWYAARNPDVIEAGIDPYYHWVHAGCREGRLPSPRFNWFSLRERYHLSGDNAEVFRTLMLRWRVLGGDAGEERAHAADLMQDEIRANHRPSPYYEGHAVPPFEAKRACEVYAFYLTQYHRVAENDAWWGEGFTEWHNVVRGTPRFSGHYQPRVPAALGFYDLEDPRTLPRQVALAKQAGIAGFAFYYYNFGHQRLLERPLDRFLADPALDARFFLIWANETWSRRWDGSESEILLEQQYPDTLPGDVADDLVRYAADPRYRRIGGRPLFVIYRVAHLPDPLAWIAAFPPACAARGEDPVIWLAQTFEDLDPRPYGLDGAMEFPPHKHSRQLPLAQPERPFGANPDLKVWDYDRFVAAALADLETPPAYPLVRACFPSWDNDSRRQGASSVIHGSTPALFRQWLEPLVKAAEAESDDPIVCINAWNEWGEGAYLEPDRHFGYAYLNAVQAVMHPLEERPALRIVLVGHDAFAAGAQRLLLHLGRTLVEDMGASVRFVLLRGDPGYDALLDDYRAVAPTIVCDAAYSVATVATALRAQGYAAAIVNSGASAAALGPLADAGLAVLSLIHELPAMAETLGFAPVLAAAADRVRFVASTPSVAAVIADAGVADARIALRPQGQYRRIAPVDRATARARLIGRDDDRAIVAGLGYGDRRKGIDLFVATAEAARDAGLAMLFVWQGDWDGGAADALADAKASLIASGHLLHLPDDPDIAGLLCAADLFFLSSREDPLPSAAIEAWSCGLPVAALAGGGGITDLIADHDDLGVIAPEEDAAMLLETVREGLAMGLSEARARWSAERFDWPAYVRALVRLVLAPPVVDVAIIGHNHGRFAEARATSIARQTLPARRVTYHDVASTDGSPAAAAEAAARVGFAYRDEPANGGRLFETWRALVEESDAEFIHLAEGDDRIAPEMLERCVAALIAAPHAAYAFVGVEWIDDADERLADHVGYPASVIGADIAEGGAIDAAGLLASRLRVRNP